MHVHLNPFLQAAFTRAVCSHCGQCCDSTTLSEAHPQLWSAAEAHCPQGPAQVKRRQHQQPDAQPSLQTLPAPMAPEDLMPLKGRQTPEIDRRCGKGEWDPYKCPVQNEVTGFFPD